MIEFNNKRGLCGNLSTMFGHGADVDINTEMMRQFEQAGLDLRYPFGQHEYQHRKDQRSMHECPKRLQWAFDHARNPPKGQSEELTKFYKAWYWWASSIDGVPHGYANYTSDGNGKFVRTPCTKAQYEAELKRLAGLRTATTGTAITTNEPL